MIIFIKSLVPLACLICIDGDIHAQTHMISYCSLVALAWKWCQIFSYMRCSNVVIGSPGYVMWTWNWSTSPLVVVLQVLWIVSSIQDSPGYLPQVLIQWFGFIATKIIWRRKQMYLCALILKNCILCWWKENSFHPRKKLKFCT